ncbi:MAG: GMP reductase [Pseudomonadota bacterium]|nr:GMP reductase [Pseudomonadota bacterium]MEC8499227.1 GMP reductase [Pseudomonadota bacterium]
MLINEEIKLDYSDVLIRPKRSTMSSRGEVNLERTHKFLWSKKEWSGIPIMSANMDTVGTPSMHTVLSKHNMVTCPARHYLKNSTKEFKGKEDNICWFGGIDEIDNLKEVQSGFIGLDVANGYTIRFVDAVKKLREKCPDATIAAGNVVTADMTQELVLAGADIVKVGIGPGSVCTTRIKTGIGYPQLSAVIECADAAHGLNAHIIADGGCVSSGDIVKAFAGGADFVMIGGMLAGHDECEGKVENGFMEFYGMASESAMDKHDNHNSYRGAEGKTVKIPHRGRVDNTIKDILSGIRSACTYVGANSLRTLSKCTTFVRVNNTHNTIYEL